MRSSRVVVVGSACLCLCLTLAAACADIGGGGSDGDQADGGDGCEQPVTWYSDRDGDGFGDPIETRSACARPAGYVPEGGDCDDDDERAHPGADDLCNGADDDCSGTADDGACAIGCADGQREGFVDQAAFPDIAACDGGWSAGGVMGAPPAACANAAGDDSGNPAGQGCSAGDICSPGFHVCTSAAEVGAKGGCAGLGAIAAVFYACGQSGAGLGSCGLGANDVFGCGALGAAPALDCAPLDRFSSDLCTALGAPWNCGPDNVNEAQNVVKQAPEGGGVLCCRN